MRTDRILRHTFCSAPIALAAALIFAACAGADRADADDRAPAADAAGTWAREAGTFAFDGDTHSFRILRCDLSGSREDGMVLQGAGELSDGRRLRVEVERRGSDHIHEQVFVVFGTLMEGDNWKAGMHRVPDGRWFADEAGATPTVGPLLTVSDNDLMVDAVFEREGDDSTRRGVLRARCTS
jgi:hypothetical protein